MGTKYIGLKYDASMLDSIRNAPMPLTKEQEHFIENEMAGDEAWLTSNKWARSYERLIDFVTLYRNKLIYRIFACRTKIDRRKKDNGIRVDIVEVLRGMEGCAYALIKNINVNYMCGKDWKAVYPGEVNKERYLKYKPLFFSNNWNSNVEMVDYLDFAIYLNCQGYTVEDLIKMKPELKYSQITAHDNPIMFLAKYDMCPGMELLRKLKFTRLQQSKLALNRLNKNDKGFQKFLFQCAKLGYLNEPYQIYSSYYKRYKFDMSHWDDEQKYNALKIDILLNNREATYYWNHKEKFDSSIYNLRELSLYLTRKGIEFRFYKDYYDLCIRVGHDMRDQYWMYPNDFHKANQKVMAEYDNVKKLNSKLKYDYLKEVLVGMEKEPMKIGGYDVFITSDIEKIKKQCDTLYQCLIRNDYIGKVIQQEEILVFFWKDGEPKYTAEVFYNGKVGQFYGDERDRTTCQAPEEMRTYLAEFLKTIKLTKRKVETKVKYFKGFYSKKDDGTFVGYNNFEFVIGKTYATQFDDETIEKAGASGCNATNKVFHFCESIEEISKHYAPNYYCEVEPLGPVLDCNGALLTNKLKIVREVQVDRI